MKMSGYDLITCEILNEPPVKTIVKLAHLLNATFRLKYIRKTWKIVEVKMILKLGKTLPYTNQNRFSL